MHSLNGLVAVLAQLPFVLACAPNTCISTSIGGECWDTIWLKSFFMAFFNSSFVFSRLRLLSFSSSLFHSSLRFPIISTNYCGLIDAKELLEAYDVCPKCWVIVTPLPATRTRPGCFSRSMIVLSISS